MIRDPSDGTVRGKPSKGINLEANETGHKSAISASKEIISGLPTDKLKAEELARLEASREWIIQRNRRASD